MSYRVIRILRRHIRAPTRNDWDNCPLCRALKERYPAVPNIQVFDEYIRFNGSRVSHTEDTREFALRFNTEKVGPCAVVIPNFANYL